jgi:aldose sugar dehydrogenase
MHTGKPAHYFAFALAISLVAPALAQSVDADYSSLCAGCHGATFTVPGGSTVRRDVAEMAGIIRDGSPARGMPAFATRLPASRIQALAQMAHAATAARGGALGSTVQAETLAQRSAGYVLMAAEQQPQTRYVGYFGPNSSLCYENIDLTGVRSLELSYARGADDPARFAVLVGDGNGAPRINLGEKATRSTGGWETFERHSVGLDRPMSGRHVLCFHGLKGDGIFNLDSFTLSDRAAGHDGLTWQFTEPPPRVVTAAGYRFAVEKVAEAESDLWSMSILRAGTILAAQKNGQLLMIDGGKVVGQVVGIPKVWNGGQGGLMAVMPHPQYTRNGWIYLTFSDVGANGASTMTRVVRGKLDGLRWVDQQDIYRAPAEFYSPHYAHFGSRIAFADGYLYFGIGDRQQPEHAQDLAYPYGKIHRLHDDGRVPRDNPYVDREGALPSIWSYGHRNPQGMTTHPGTRAVWSAEHGPMGGDEVNLVRAGLNYGWPLVSFGTHYDGKPVGESPYLEGVEPPVHHFTPSIATSQLAFYRGDKFPEWQDQLLVASLGREELRLIRVRDDRVMNDRLLFKGLGRIRDVTVGPDGHPYVLLTQFTAGVYRLRPLVGSQ